MSANTTPTLATAMPNQRPNAPPRQIDSAARNSSAPNPMAIQPQVVRSAMRMYAAPATTSSWTRDGCDPPDDVGGRGDREHDSCEQDPAPALLRRRLGHVAGGLHRDLGTRPVGGEGGHRSSFPRALVSRARFGQACMSDYQRMSRAIARHPDGPWAVTSTDDGVVCGKLRPAQAHIARMARERAGRTLWSPPRQGTERRPQDEQRRSWASSGWSYWLRRACGCSSLPGSSSGTRATSTRPRWPRKSRCSSIPPPGRLAASRRSSP